MLCYAVPPGRDCCWGGAQRKEKTGALMHPDALLFVLTVGGLIVCVERVCVYVCWSVVSCQAVCCCYTWGDDIREPEPVVSC